ncbi:MAG: hydrogenase maturation nickel metallochaperone HypA [Gammaproteobacteria bacterium]|nr:hydrogenase maturation nickel metallochaperone HypA [Gammaproteobacteria bacterium]
MHEMSLCEGIIQILEDESDKQGFQKVKQIWLEIGALSHVEPQAMYFCFDAVKQNTLAADAKLTILDIPGTAWCMNCAKNVKIKQRYDECPHCGSVQLQVTEGEEMKIKELEVE